MNELTILAWALVLALVQIFLTVMAVNNDKGLKYNIGPRDEPGKPLSNFSGRMMRAQSNLFETLPIFAGAVLIAHALGRENNMTMLGAELFLIARIVYVPLYALGVPVLRTLTWAVSIVGLVMILVAILHS